MRILFILLTLILIILLSLSSASQWTRTYGGLSSDGANYVAPTSDNGFILTGWTESYGVGGKDIWLIKIDAEGNIVWDRTLGDENNDEGYCVAETSDGGYIISGLLDGAILIKTDALGFEEWRKSYEDGKGVSVAEASDGGFVFIAQYQWAYWPYDVFDFEVKKIDSGGNEEWEVEFEGYEKNWWGNSIIETSDGNFVITGETKEQMDDWYYLLLAKINSEGEVLWKREYINSWYFEGNSVAQTEDEGFIITGRYSRDIFLCKTDSNGIWEWKKLYTHGIWYNVGLSLAVAPDNGYLVTGWVGDDTYDKNVFCFKTDAAGEIEFSNTIWGYFDDAGTCIKSLGGEDYVISGWTASYGVGQEDAFITCNRENINFPPNPPILLDPYNGALFSYSNITFSWINQGDPDGDYVRSRLLIDKWDGFDWVNDYDLDAGDAENWTIDFCPGYYRWKVCIYDPQHNSETWEVCFPIYWYFDCLTGYFWEKQYGGEFEDAGKSIAKTSDGGYIITGYYQTSVNNKDLLLLKTDANGNEQWLKTFGGTTHDDYGNSVINTSDAGFVIVGCYGSGYNFDDVWLIKTDLNGNELWNRTFGSADREEEGNEVIETPDGGFAIISTKRGSDIKYINLWLIKTDSEGFLEWEQTYNPEDGYSYGRSLTLTSDGGFALLGHFIDDDYNIWLVKTDASGNQEWYQTYGGTDPDFGESIKQCPDNGFIIAGSTKGNIWVFKTDSKGSLEWQYIYGDDGGDYSNDVDLTDDGGYIVTGQFERIIGSPGVYLWLGKFDIDGDLLWSRIFGEKGNVYVGFSVVQASDGGFTACGYGKEDIYLVHYNNFEPIVFTPTLEIIIFIAVLVILGLISILFYRKIYLINQIK